MGAAQANGELARGAGPRLHAVQSPAALTLAAVYREHVDFVVRMTANLGVPDAHVEDVVHDVFLVVHRRLPDYDGRGTMRSWLYGITRRVVLHHKRKFTRTRAREAVALQPRPLPAADEDVARKQAAEAVRISLDALDEDQRIVVVLADIEGMPVPEIARTVGAKLNTVYSRLRLGRKKFEAALAAVLTPARDAAREESR